jgi:hypothetical protein
MLDVPRHDCLLIGESNGGDECIEVTNRATESPQVRGHLAERLTFGFADFENHQCAYDALNFLKLSASISRQLDSNPQLRDIRAGGEQSFPRPHDLDGLGPGGNRAHI